MSQEAYDRAYDILCEIYNYYGLDDEALDAELESLQDQLTDEEKEKLDDHIHDLEMEL